MIGLTRILILAATLILFLPMTTLAQGTSQAKDDKQSGTPPRKPEQSSANREKKSVASGGVPELRPVSTAEAARSAAEDRAKEQKSGAAKSPAGPSSSDKSAAQGSGDPVTEFRPAAEGSAASAAAVVKTKDSKKSVLKNVHGTAYGSLDPKNRGSHQAAGSVGGSSKSGKTSVYVETDSSRTAAPSSH